jgi:hypothetical protein
MLYCLSTIRCTPCLTRSRDPSTHTCPPSNLEMTTSLSPTSKKEKRNLVDILRSGTRKVKNATTAWKRVSDEVSKRDSVVTQESGCRNSAKSEYLVEKFRISGQKEAVFDADRSWETYAERYSIGSEIDCKQNPEGKQAKELADDYRRIIGRHPFEVEWEIERKGEAKELIGKKRIARKAREVGEIKAVEDAILERKRRQWDERKEANERAKKVEEQGRAHRAAMAKQKREREQAAIREEANKTAEARKRQSNTSAITAWPRFLDSANAQKLGSGKINVATERVNVKMSSKSAATPSVSSLAKGLASSRYPDRHELAQGSKSSTTSSSQPPRRSQDQSSGLGSDIPMPLTQEEIHDMAARLALERFKNLHQEFTEENEIQSSSRRVSEEAPPRPRLSQQEFLSRTQHPGGVGPPKSRTWPKNMGSPAKGPGEGRELPKLNIVNREWVEENTGKTFSSGTSEAHGHGGGGTDISSASLAARKGDRNDGRRVGFGISLPKFSSYDTQVQLQPSFASRKHGEQKTSEGSELAFGKSPPRKRPGISMDVAPLFLSPSRCQHDNSSAPRQRPPQPGSQCSISTPIDTPTASISKIKPSNDDQFISHKTPPSVPSQLSAPMERPPPVPERSKRKQPPESLIAADLKVGRSTDRRYA